MNMELDSFPTKVTGTLISYSRRCERQTWLFAHGLDFENITPNDHVIIGKLIDETSFSREKRRRIILEDSVIDFIRYNKEIIVHEVKKSMSFKEVHAWQVKYYIYLLRKHGLNARIGIIHYPKYKRKIEITYTEGDEKEIEKSLKKLDCILEHSIPPPPINKPCCKKCSYYEFCYI